MNEKNDLKGNVTCTMKATFPSISAFKEWDDDCKENFNDCRWMKMMYDHKMSKNVETVSSLFDSIAMLESRIGELEEKLDENKDLGKKRLTLGKGGIVND